MECEKQTATAGEWAPVVECSLVPDYCGPLPVAHGAEVPHHALGEVRAAGRTKLSKAAPFSSM